MKSLQETIEKRQQIKTGANSERASLIEEFVNEINKERIRTKYKMLEPKVIAIKLAHVPTQDLYRFLSTCKDYKARNQSFNKCFFGALKID